MENKLDLRVALKKGAGHPNRTGFETPMNLRTFLRKKHALLLEKRGTALIRFASSDLVKEVIARFHPRNVGHELIRLGGEADGGYLVPDDLEGLTACFSPGVSDVADFELTLAEQNGVQCYLADASVDRSPVEHPLVYFERKFLGPNTTGETIRLTDWVNEKVGTDDRNLLLQMDIEGAEYAVLVDTPLELLERFRIIVLELHDLEDLFFEPSLKYLELILGKLTQSHTVVHLHPNNVARPVTRNGVTIPRLLEVTLIRNDRFKNSEPVVTFPHPLDRRNVTNQPDLILPRDWYAA